MTPGFPLEPDARPAPTRPPRADRPSRLATPEPTPVGWDGGPLGWLRCPRLHYLLALLLVGGALWLRFDARLGSLDGNDAGTALEQFRDAEGSWHWAATPAQREVVTWVLLGLGLLTATLLGAGRRRGGLAAFTSALGFVFVLTSRAAEPGAIARAAGCALVVGGMLVARADRGHGAWRVLATGIVVLLATFLVPPAAGAMARTAAYEAPLLTSIHALGGDDLGTAVLTEAPTLLAALLALLGFVALLGLRARWGADAGAVLLVLFVAAVVTRAVTGTTPGPGASNQLLEGGEATLHRMGALLRHDAWAFVLPLAMALGECTRPRRP
jgi:hypothetical protein